jgi:hypothetical protein
MQHRGTCYFLRVTVLFRIVDTDTLKIQTPSWLQIGLVCEAPALARVGSTFSHAIANAVSSATVLRLLAPTIANSLLRPALRLARIVLLLLAVLVVFIPRVAPRRSISPCSPQHHKRVCRRRGSLLSAHLCLPHFRPGPITALATIVSSSAIGRQRHLRLRAHRCIQRPVTRRSVASQHDHHPRQPALVLDTVV